MINLMSHYIRLQFQRLPIIWEKPLVVAETELISELIEQDVPIVLVGSGSSLNAAEAVESYFHQFTTKEIRRCSPSEYLEVGWSAKPHVLIAISQTGSSVGTMTVLKEAKQNQYTSLLLTANLTSEGSKVADHVIDLMCSEETIGPKSIGFTATLMRLIQLALRIGKAEGTLSTEKEAELNASILANLRQLANAEEQTKKWLAENSRWSKLPYATVTSNAFSGITKEGTLKLLETLRVPVLFFEIEEFTHGPHRLIHEDSFHILVIEESSKKEMSERVATYIEQFPANRLILARDPELNDIPLGEIGSAYGAEFIYCIVFQVLANEFALKTGFNPDEKIHPAFFQFVGSKQ